MRTSDITLDKLNTITKYPSIPTYHALGERGRLIEKTQVCFKEGNQHYSEKIDGTNSRIIIYGGGDYFIGSREELLTFRGDIIHNPALGIVKALRPTADIMASDLCIEDDMVYVLYGEVYGHRIGKNGKQYTSKGQVGFRLFDVVKMSEHDMLRLMEKPLPELASWRDNGGQKFITTDELSNIANELNIELTPRLPCGVPLPESIEDTYEWLKMILPYSTNAALDGDSGKPEGVVIRSNSRSKIAKIRFEDYERTLKVRE